jgi:glycosyltransferase involved in cell wall biosynthesis
LLGPLHGNLTSTVLIGALEREIRRRRPPDLVHVHGCRLGQAWVLRWAELHGIASVYTEHVNIADWDGPWDTASPELLCRTADAVACVSERARSSLQAILPSPRTIALTRHIVRPSEGERTLDQTAESSAPPRLVCVARLEPHKGIEFLLRAFAILTELRPDARLTIAGDGADRRKLERLARELGLTGNVAFLGNTSREQVGRILDEADVAVLPSLTEGLPVSLLEALARGIPVVASRVGGIPELVQDRVNGLLVPPADSAALAGALKLLVSDPTLRLQLAQSARRIFRTMGLDEQAVVAGILDLYREARGRRAERAACPEISKVLGG